MTIEMGGPGIPGFGYGNQGPQADNDQAKQPQAAPETGAARAPAPPQADNGAGQNQAAHDGASAGEAEEVVSRDLGYDQVPGFEMSASNCVNRARQIARSLNHATFSSDHLMLALTMDQNARRLLERVADVNQLRAVAMQKLGKNYNKSDTGNQAPTPTADLADIGKRALQAAAEREQLVSISDLIDAFHKENDRLTYAAGDGSRAIAVMETIEKRVIPGVNDAVTRIENAVVDAMQRQHQSVQSILTNLNSLQAQEWQRQQREFMDEIRRQVREAADVQFAAALKDLNEKFGQKIAEPTPQVVPDNPLAGAAPAEDTAPEQGSGAPKPTWNWLGLIL